LLSKNKTKQKTSVAFAFSHKTIVFPQQSLHSFTKAMKSSFSIYHTLFPSQKFSLIQ